ncbi:unnamed protein product [Ixodes persulcatus]
MAYIPYVSNIDRQTSKISGCHNIHLLSFIFFSSSTLLLCAHPQTQRGQNITQILNAFFTRGYDKRVRPNYGGDVAGVDGGVNSKIISFSTSSLLSAPSTHFFFFCERLRSLSVVTRGSVFFASPIAERTAIVYMLDVNEISVTFRYASPISNTFLHINKKVKTQNRETLIQA